MPKGLGAKGIHPPSTNASILELLGSVNEMIAKKKRSVNEKEKWLWVLLINHKYFRYALTFD